MCIKFSHCAKKHGRVVEIFEYIIHSVINCKKQNYENINQNFYVFGGDFAYNFRQCNE